MWIGGQKHRPTIERTPNGRIPALTDVFELPTDCVDSAPFQNPQRDVTAFGARGEPGDEWYETNVVEGGQDRIQALWKIRKHLRNLPHSGAESTYFRENYVAGWSPGTTSLSGLRCSQGCTHEFGCSAGEKQIWTHVTAENPQQASKHELAVLEATKRSVEPIESFFFPTKRARTDVPATNVRPDAPSTDDSESASVRARAPGQVVDLTTDSDKDDDSMNLTPATDVTGQRRACSGFRLPGEYLARYPLAAYAVADYPWSLLAKYKSVTLYAHTCTSFAERSQVSCSNCARLASSTT